MVRTHRRTLAVLTAVALAVALLPLTALPAAAATFHSIPEIQGPDQFSTLVGDTVRTQGIVTAITANGRDAWIQDPVGDGDPATSDGIFIDDFNTLAPQPAVGDLITVEGEVEEQQFGVALPLTRLDDTVLISIDSTGNPLPKPVELKDLPNESVIDGIDFWESLEGMLVMVRNGRVVAPTTRFGEFGMLARKDSKKGSGFQPRTRQILLRSLGEDPNVVDYNPERILVDDATLASPIVVRPRDTVKRLTGVVDYTFGAYKLQPTNFDVRAKKYPRSPQSRRSGGMGAFTITTFNVANLFDLVDNPDKPDEGSTPTPAQLETQLTKLAAAIEDELLLPEIMVLQEVENTAITQELGDRVNAAAGTSYVAASFETSDARGIEVAFLYDTDRATLTDVFQLEESFAPGTSAAYGPDSPSPGREPLAGHFDVGGQYITIVGNHFKSKSGDDPIFSMNWLDTPPQPFDRVTEVQRKAQAQVVRDYVDDGCPTPGGGYLCDGPSPKVMVTGDLNDFEFGEPGEGADDPVSIVEGAGGPLPLTNLIFMEKEIERFSFVFDGNSQVLDHMLVSPALYDITKAADFLHFNATYPANLAGEAGTTLRASDHDAFEGRFKP